LFASTFIQRRGGVLIQNLTFSDVNARITTLTGFTESVRVSRVLMLNALLNVTLFLQMDLRGTDGTAI